MKKVILISFLIGILITSCSSNNIVVYNGIDLSKYQHVIFGKESTGDRSLDDIMLMVQNEISNTKLNVVSLYNLSSAGAYILTPHINVKSEKWDGGHTYITITFYDYYTNQAVAVVKSSGIGLSISHDQDLAIRSIKKKLQQIFGSKSPIL